MPLQVVMLMLWGWLGAQAQLILTNDTQNQRESLQIPIYRVYYAGNAKSFNMSLTGLPVLCGGASSLNYTSNTLAILTDPDLPFEPVIRAFQRDPLVVGLLVLSYLDTIGELSFLNDGGTSADIHLPVYEIPSASLAQIEKYLQRHKNVTAFIPQGGYSEWYLAVTAPWVPILQIVLIIVPSFLLFYNICLMIVKWILFPKVNLSQLCLGLDCGGIIIKVIWAFSTFGWNHIYVFWVHKALYSWWVPFQVAAVVLVLFYWSKRLKRSNVTVMDIEKKYKRATFFILVGLFAFELASSLSRVLTFNSGFYNFTQGVYVLTIVLIISYLIYVKYKLRVYIISHQTPLSAHLRKTSYILDGMAVSLFILLVFQIYKVSLRSSVQGYMIGWIGTFCLSHMVSLCIGLIFFPRKKHPRDTQRSKSQSVHSQNQPISS